MRGEIWINLALSKSLQASDREVLCPEAATGAGGRKTTSAPKRATRGEEPIELFDITGILGNPRSHVLCLVKSGMR